MKCVSLFLLLVLPVFAISQTSASIEITTGAHFSDFTHKLSNTKGRICYDFGMAMTLPTKHARREWLLGLRFMTYGDKSNSGGLRWGSQHNGQGGFDPSLPSLETISKVDYRYSQYYLEAPVAFRYYFFDGKMRLFVQGSAGPSVYLTYRNARNLELKDGTSQSFVQTGNDGNIRRLNAVAGLSLGMELPMSSKLSVNLNPQAQTQLLSIASNSTTGAKWYAYGIRAGLRYRFF